MEIHYLAFEGGGTRTFSYVGALQILNKLKLLDNIKGTAGTSAGSLFALFLNIGLTVEQIVEIVYSTNWDIILKGGNDYIVSRIIRFIIYYGEYNGNYIENTIKKLLIKYVGKDMTFLELYNYNNKDLIVIASNITKGKPIFFSHKTTPHIKVSLAMRASMACPFIYCPVKINGDLYNDGGYLIDYPYLSFEMVLGINSYDNVFGLKLKSEQKDVVTRNNTSTIINYCYSMINTIIYFIINNNSYVNKKVDNNTIYVEYDPNYKLIDTNIKKEEIDRLIDLGKKSAVLFLNKNKISF